MDAATRTDGNSGGIGGSSSRLAGGSLPSLFHDDGGPPRANIAPKKRKKSEKQQQQGSQGGGPAGVLHEGPVLVSMGKQASMFHNVEDGGGDAEKYLRVAAEGS